MLDNKCWYKKVCPLHLEDCYKTCPKFRSMSNQINKCGITDVDKYISVKLNLQKKNKESFKKLQTIKDNIKDFVRNGENLFIYSENFQNGKTTWSLKIMYKYFDEVWAEIGDEQGGFFLHVPTFLSKYKTFDSQNTTEFEELMDVIKESHLVIWDSISSYNLNKNDENLLYSLIEYRISNKKANIFNGLNDDSVKERMGSLLFKRVLTVSKQVEIIGQYNKQFSKEVC